MFKLVYGFEYCSFILFQRPLVHVRAHCCQSALHVCTFVKSLGFAILIIRALLTVELICIDLGVNVFNQKKSFLKLKMINYCDRECDTTVTMSSRHTKVKHMGSGGNNQRHTQKHGAHTKVNGTYWSVMTIRFYGKRFGGFWW